MTITKRGFEVISSYSGTTVSTPKRSTATSAGYDFEATEDVIIPPLYETLAELSKADKEDLIRNAKPVLVPTGIKAYMGKDEFLMLANRSSNPLKKFLIIPNGVGIIDSDYYNNESNEGHIYFQFINAGPKPIEIKRGDKIGQGIFIPFLVADGDEASQTRTGGFGSTSNV